MRVMLRALLSSVLVVAGVVMSAPVRSEASTAPQSVVVVYIDGVDPLTLTRAFERSLGVAADRVYTAALDGFAAALTPAQIDAVRADPRVLYVANDIPFALADRAPVAAGETVPTGVRRIDAAS